jgi:hypothetical protein
VSLRLSAARMFALALVSLLVVVFFVALVDEGVRMYRGWRNADGTTVEGYALYEKHYSSSAVVEQLRKSNPSFQPQEGWEFLDFHQWGALCRFQAGWSQREWTSKRARLLSRPSPDVVFTESDLPVVRYQCFRMDMLYRSGMGWGLF